MRAKTATKRAEGFVLLQGRVPELLHSFLRKEK
jgi:hypothetical protein